MVSNLVWERMASHSHDDLIFFPAGLGYMKEYPYERVMRDSRILLIFEVSNMLWVNFETLCKEGFFRGSISFRFYWWMFVYKTGHLPLKILPAFPFFLCLTGNKRNPPNVHSSCRNAACRKTLARSIKVSCYLRNVKVTVHWLLYWYCEEKLSLGRFWEVNG